MRHYIGIDLGTTNSAVCCFDGVETQVLKSPEQADVTPSAIYMDRHGHIFYGRKAFDLAARHPENAATLFKRYLGTNKSYHFEDADASFTPVECSARLLKELYGYLPEEIRTDRDTVTVITVPAAFNQMKKDATLEAARLAGLGLTALMQEPVAAVMSVLKKDDAEKTFLIYDLGGGTYDVSVARMTGGHVSLLAQGGREMCGGRDLDRRIYHETVLPWLRQTYSYPQDPDAEERYLSAKQTILHAIEQAKIALSSVQETELWVDEDALHLTDEAGKEVVVDLRLTREDLAGPVEDVAKETVQLARETMRRAGVSAKQIDQIVFVGGPTMYAPLRDMVCTMLEIPRGTAVNPMTAVAEGAAIYAESINWESPVHEKKETYAQLKEQAQQIQVRYEARCSGTEGKIAVIVPDGQLRIAQVVSVREDGLADGVFDSGRVNVIRQAVIRVPLSACGQHRFSLTVRDAAGEVCFGPGVIELTRVLASVDAIPASHSIAVQALDRPGGTPVPVYLVEAGDPLPKTGRAVFHAAAQLVGGSSGALSFSLWEGEIREPVDDNRYIGTYRIPGEAVSGSVISMGSEILCDYEMDEAGNLRLGVSIPSMGLRLEDRNFYSRLEGQTDVQDTSALVKETKNLLNRTAQMKLHVVDEGLDSLREKLLRIQNTLTHSMDPESVAGAENDLIDCYRDVARLQRRYSSVMQLHDLEEVLERFERVKEKATVGEIAAFHNLEEEARFSIDMGSSDFTQQLEEMRRQIGALRWRQDDVVRNAFLNLIRFPGDFTDRARFDQLLAQGQTCLENHDMNKLREVVSGLLTIKKETPGIPMRDTPDEIGIYR